MRFRRFPVVLLLVALSSILGNAQTRHDRFSIGGTVRDNVTHRTMDGILVSVKQSTGTPLNTTITRSNGDFEFDFLPNGDYIIEINIKDYEKAQETVTINNASRMGVSIFLTKTASASTAPPIQMSISAHQLSVPHKAYEEFEKGMALAYMKSDFHGALAQFQLAIKDFPTYYEAYAEEGSAYYQLQDNEHAEEALRKSVELSSGQYADAIFTLSALLTDTKRYAEAETTARQGIATDSSSWRGPFELARALNALKRPEEAEKSAQQARDIMPDNPPVYLLLANIHIQRKNYAALIRDLDEYLRLSPNGPEADQARKTRERVEAVLNDAKGSATGAAEKKSQDDQDDDDETDSTTDKQPPAPDNSGLPSLPPPTQEH